MSTKAPFTKHVTYSFTVRGEDYNVVAFNETKICIEEEEKDGNEDYFYGELNLENGRWVLEDEAASHLERNIGRKQAPAIEHFFDEYGLPTEL